MKTPQAPSADIADSITRAVGTLSDLGAQERLIRADIDILEGRLRDNRNEQARARVQRDQAIRTALERRDTTYRWLIGATGLSKARITVIKARATTLGTDTTATT